MPKTYRLLLLLVIIGQSSGAQTLAECSNNYHNQFNKIELQRIQRKTTNRIADSLSNVLTAKFDACIIGKELMDFRLVGRSGKIHSKDSLLGKVVLLNFWSLGCGPCIMEIPVFNRLYNAYKHKENFVIISVLWDDEGDLERFLQRRFNNIEIDYEIVPNGKPMMKGGLFKFVKAMPTNLFLDKEGKVFFKTIGGISDSGDEQVLEAKLKSIIDAQLNK